ncbi:MAG: hypothetical protein QM758_04710 [Armatimonas sp.]
MKRMLLLTLLCLLAFGAEAHAPQNEGKRRYRFTAYWKIKDAKDGLDNKVECYGELRINSALQWKILASEAKNYKRKKDETLTVFFGTKKPKKSYYETEMYWNGYVTVKAFLKNRNITKGDTLLSEFTLPLSPQIAVNYGERVVGSTDKAELRYSLEEVQ